MLFTTVFRRGLPRVCFILGSLSRKLTRNRDPLYPGHSSHSPRYTYPKARSSLKNTWTLAPSVSQILSEMNHWVSARRFAPIGLTGNVPTGATALTSAIMVLFFTSAGGVTPATRIFGFLTFKSLALICSSQSRGGDLHGQRQT